MANSSKYAHELFLSLLFIYCNCSPGLLNALAKLIISSQMVCLRFLYLLFAVFCVSNNDSIANTHTLFFLALSFAVFFFATICIKTGRRLRYNCPMTIIMMILFICCLHSTLPSSQSRSSKISSNCFFLSQYSFFYSFRKTKQKESAQTKSRRVQMIILGSFICAAFPCLFHTQFKWWKKSIPDKTE